MVKLLEAPRSTPFTTCLRVDSLRERGLVSRKVTLASLVKLLSSHYQGLTPERLNRKKLSPDMVLLKGNHGESAHIVRNDWRAGDLTAKLVVHSPLELNVRQQREWLKTASKFFKPLCTAVSEMDVLGRGFKVLVRRPFKETSELIRGSNGGSPMILRSRSATYAEYKKPYSIREARASALAKRARWLVEQYLEMKRDGRRSSHAGQSSVWDLLDAKLSEFPKDHFGKLPSSSRDLTKLEPDTIQRIVYKSLRVLRKASP